MGSFSPKFQSLSPRSLFALYSDGRLCMNFGYIGDGVGKEATVEGVREDLAWNISTSKTTTSTPTYPLLMGSQVVDFLELLDRLRTDQAQKSG